MYSKTVSIKIFPFDSVPIATNPFKNILRYIVLLQKFTIIVNRDLLSQHYMISLSSTLWTSVSRGVVREFGKDANVVTMTIYGTTEEGPVRLLWGLQSKNDLV